MKTIRTQVIERLRAIANREIVIGRRQSSVILLREYMRRAASLESRAGVRLDLFLSPEQLPHVDRIALSGIRESLRPITGQMKNVYAAKYLGDFALWSLLVDEGHPIARLEPELFEPLIKMIERGEIFRQHHGDAEFDCFATPMMNWRAEATKPPRDISDTALAEWDVRGYGS